MKFAFVIFAWTMYFSPIDGEFDASTCGITKTCHRNMNGCSLAEPTCLFFSYAWVSYDFFWLFNFFFSFSSQYSI